MLKLLDGEIMDLTDESNLANEIEQAVEFKGDIYTAMVTIGSQITAPVTSVLAPSMVDTPNSAAAPRGSGVKLLKFTL